MHKIHYQYAVVVCTSRGFCFKFAT